ncbi:U32 family peptidase [Shewanella oneidensis MR-1]|uniref:Peptidase U32 family YdcP n=1 Tax=Shewanella oneidensis (strain ATCC 700550 / JCM 31522 / CIP 106686 / LMG 19005 / NCIMB 14063 / MR-1) TaxID=211586 RepID=Q8EAU4_SHEON|nr:U32 family peptidase [Shewanella oneidensis]AAN56778.1 peptidase U32 family YdcP [Shewanella oneidensis MR-1]MDX5998851.1 U32 family peptidase [Shewanella oneidensis]MEE2027576.1 23S rRNA 5-hydroxycytidine synthase [Shewanella oneidensis]QKG98109.1 U32 family peptidase [Shewanella oneidensis MR-1]
MSQPEIYTPEKLSHVNNRLELLAPAKNADYGIEAIRHGADAVYIGGPAFGARATAGNSVEDIARLCTFAHKYHAQVFVALNTILMDDELAVAEKLIWDVYNAGADALIVQDMGVLQLNLPPIALHASTQMDNRNPEKVAFLEQVGFSQVVLARELGLSQIREVAAHTNMQIEFFIHGALCVAYSGLCNLSHAFSNRSANRGECSQMCRLPGNLKTRQGDVLAKNEHLLSLKDNNQTDNLEALIDAGVRSFKIEGRLKDLSYVKNVTAHYRQKLDAIMARRPEFVASSHGRTEHTFTPDPEKTFNRGSTDYFVHERSQGIKDFRSPKYIGQDVGKVVAIGKDFIQVSSTHEFNNGDGLAYFPPNYAMAKQSDDKLQGLRVNRAEGHKLHVLQVPRDLRVGMTLYRNHNQAFEALLAKESAKRIIAVDMRLIDTTAGVALTLTDMYGLSASVELAVEKTPATDAEKTLQTIRTQLSKLGSTDFVARQISIETAEPWFLPASTLNGLRRDAVAALELARIEGYQRPKPWKYNQDAVYPFKHLSYLGNVANEKAKDFYQRHGVIEIQDTYEKNGVTEDVPLMVTKHCLRFNFNLCPKEVPGIKADPMVLEIGNDVLKLVFDCPKCEMLVVGENRQVRGQKAL